MKRTLYLLAIASTLLISCSKKSDEASQLQTPEGSITSCVCKTIYSTPSVPSARWTVDIKVRDTNSVLALSLKASGSLSPIMDIDKPKSKSYTASLPGRSCPTYNSNAFYFFEWRMKDGIKITLDAFQVWEQ